MMTVTRIESEMDATATETVMLVTLNVIEIGNTMNVGTRDIKA